MKISKKSQYGLRALVYLAKNSSSKAPCSLKKISEKEEIPFNFLEKIMVELEKEKLVKAKKGVTGGYYLAKKPKDITPAHVLFALEEPAILVGCAGCPRSGSCSTEDVWGEAQESLDSVLESVTLKDLIKKNAKK